MRLLVFALMALLGVSSVTFSGGGASAFIPATPSGALGGQLVQDAKIVCGDTGDGYKCRTEPGALRRGKMRPIPTSPSDQSSGGWFGGSEDSDALPPASGGTDGSTQAAPATCPANTEMLAGHCIPYTQTCNRGLAANANPQACRGAEEKQVCSFRADGLKDCCCRTYSKF